MSPSMLAPRDDGGFTVPASDTSVRPRLTAAEIATFVPERGPFTFPDPYRTSAVRLTNPDDGAVEQLGYPYWRRIALHSGERELRVVMGRGPDPALLLTVTKRTGHVRPSTLDQLRGTGEQWYFSARYRDCLYITEGSRLLRFNVRTQRRTVVFDLGGSTTLWQCHSSVDERVHSATRRDASGEPLGAIVWQRGETVLIPRRDTFDECQIDRSGRWLVIKEGQDNRVVDLRRDEETLVLNADHALGHSDVGAGYAVGEDDYHAQPGAFVVMDLDAPSTPGRLVYHMTDWATMARHVSHTNVRAGRHPRLLVSAAHRDNLPRANELVIASLDDSLVCTVIAPTMIDLDAQPGDDYKKLSMASFDASGDWAVWWSNCGTARGDAFLVRVPQRTGT